MAKEYRNGFGVAYRELEQTSADLMTVLARGEIRMSPEEINWRREAIKDIKKHLAVISVTLDEFQKIAPPAVRAEPKK